MIFGSASLPAMVDLANLGSAGITILGVDANDGNGYSVNGAGDINGDGFDDLVIGAGGADALGNAKLSAGESYVIFGGNGFTNSILPANLGTSSVDALIGGSSAERINGAGGNDLVSGGGGADVLIGGQGNDVLIINDASFKRIVGGTGYDSLLLNNPTNIGFILDLTTLRDNRLIDVEEIDISGIDANNTLILNQREVLNLSSTSNTLIVRRNAGDIVNIGAGWTQRNHEDIGGTLFEVYRQGQATLKVQALITTSTVVNRQVFYNRSTSSVFGNGSGNPTSAIDASKQPLLPGQTAEFANYTN